MEQRSSEWYELRKTKIGASEAGAIMGLNPHKSPYQVWLCKQDGYVQEVNEAMQRGIDLESEALRLFEQETGYLMSPKVIISGQTSYLMASLDGYEIDGKCAVEIKCGGEKLHLQSIHGEIPKYYIAQMQHQIYVAELDHIYYCSYRPEQVVNPLYIEIIKRDEEFIEDMLKKEEDFYFDHMITGIPPKNPKPEPKKIDSEVWKSLTDEYLKLDQIEKDSSKRKEEIKESLLEISGAENAQGNGIILKKIERKGIISYQNIPQLKQMDLEKYRKPGTSFWQVKESSDAVD